MVTDGSGNTNACSFTVLVNRAPLAGADSMVTVENQPGAVALDAFLANDSDADGGALSITAVSPASTNGGTVQLSGTNVVYTPATNFNGQDLFNYTLSDGLGGIASGSVAVNVLAGNHPSYNRIADFSVGPDRVAMRLQGFAGRIYALERSQDLRHWNPIASVRAAADGIVHLEDPAPTPGTAFYRVSAQ